MNTKSASPIRYRIGQVFALLAGLVPLASPTSAQDVTPESVLEARSEARAEEGWEALGPVEVATLRLGETRAVTVTIHPYMSYEWEAVCGAGCDDIDLRLSDAFGSVYVEDLAVDAEPSVQWQGQESASMTIAVDLIQCATDTCEVALMGWSMDPSAFSGEFEVSEGRLQPGDSVRADGAFYDSFPVEVGAGQLLVADMRGQDWDTFLEVISPTGQVFSNDDHNGVLSWSHVEAESSQPGTWFVRASSLGPKVRGDYRLGVSVRENPSADEGAGEEPGWGGALEVEDAVLPTGERVDIHELSLEPGDHLVTVESAEFDTYLIVENPDGTTVENDDFGADPSKSQVSLHVVEAATYRVAVTSFGPGQFGTYTLTTTEGVSEASNEGGSLTADDKQTPDGQYIDTYEVSAEVGDRIVVHMASSDFDTYLEIQGPDGFSDENDDAGSIAESRLVVPVLVAGTYVIGARSLYAGETGDYEISISASPDPDAADRAAAPRLQSGDAVSGELTPDDGVTDQGIARDFALVRLMAGQHVAVILKTGGFDGYLEILGPDGMGAWENDDWMGDVSESRVELHVDGTGDYWVTVRSLSQGGFGSYDLSVIPLEVADIRKRDPSGD